MRSWMDDIPWRERIDWMPWVQFRDELALGLLCAVCTLALGFVALEVLGWFKRAR